MGTVLMMLNSNKLTSSKEWRKDSQVNSISAKSKLTLPELNLSKRQRRLLKKLNLSHYQRRAVKEAKATMVNTLARVRAAKEKPMEKIMTKTAKITTKTMIRMDTKKTGKTKVESQLCSHLPIRTKTGSTRQNKRKKLLMVMHR